MTTATNTPATKSDIPENTFASFCGFTFDPAKNSDCFQVCKKDEPEEFQKCLKNFEGLEIKPKTKTKKCGGRGKTIWGHLNGSQAGLIDDSLSTATKPILLETICLFSKGKKPRVLHHLKHLEKDLNIPVSLTEDGKIFWAENPNIKGVEIMGSISTMVLRTAKVEKEEKKEEKKEEGIVTKDAFAKVKKSPAKKSPAKKTTKKGDK